MKTSVFYKGNYIGGSLGSQNVDLISKQQTRFMENIDLVVKGALIKQMVADVSAGIDPELEYEINLQLFGIRYGFRERIKLIENLTI